MSFTLVLVRGWRLAGSGPDTPCLVLPPVPLTAVEQLAGVRGEVFVFGKLQRDCEYLSKLTYISTIQTP